MKIRGYLSRERFSMRQIAGVLAVVFVGVAVFSYAGVSIPYTFTAGTTAKAGEVNANFQALANAMPAVKRTSSGGNMLSITSTSTTTGTNLLSLQVTLPAAGKVILNATGVGCILGHTQNYRDNMLLKVSKTSGDVSGTAGVDDFSYFTNAMVIPPAIPTSQNDFCHSFSINTVFDETSTGPITYYLNGTKQESSPSATYQVMGASLTALYVPNTLQ